jgi:NAD(P)-dependent dehydrogenase (short-subunit alcohol dehydrogenase family)
MARRIRDAVVVITGASSGIGRAAALALAEQGAAVVLAARREEALREVEHDCVHRGARALVVPTDVADEAQVQRLAERAIEAFGRIDAWVNNAAVTLFGRFEEVPPEVYERVLRVNLFGYIHGARAVLPYLREQGEGVLINVASVVGYVGQPYTSAYCTSKFAIRGFSECLRQELLDAPGIQVCTVLPSSIDTPLFQHAANYTGRSIKPMEPVYPAAMVADAIVRLIRHPRREVIVGAAGQMLAAAHALAPGLTERMMAGKVESDHFADVPTPSSRGNVVEAMPQWSAVSGGWLPVGRGNGSGGTVAALAIGFALGLLAWQLSADRRPPLERLQNLRRGG